MPCQGVDEQLSTSALDSPLMDLLALLEQADAPSQLDVPNSSDAPMGDDGVQDAEQAIDAQIKQLLALKQATRQQRQHSYLLLLQQAAAGLSNSPSPVSVGLSESMMALQAQDVNNELALMQTQRPATLRPVDSWTSAGLSPQLSPNSLAASQAAALAAFPTRGSCSHSSIDIGYLQRTVNNPCVPLDGMCDLVSPGSSAAMPTPVPYGPSLGLPASMAGAAPLAASTQAAMQASLALDLDMAAAFGGLGAQDSMIFSPQPLSDAVLPLPMQAQLSTSLLSSATSLQEPLQGPAGFLPAGARVQAYYGSSATQPQMMSPARGLLEGLASPRPGCASFLGGTAMIAGPSPAGQGRNRRHSFHVAQTTCCAQGAAGYSSCCADRSMLAAGDHLVSRSSRSFTMQRPQGFDIGAPVMPAPQDALPNAGAVRGHSMAIPCVGPSAASGPVSGTPPGTRAGSPSGKKGARSGARVAARKMSLDLPCRSAAPRWADAAWNPHVEAIKSGQSGSKGTGVFMPRVAAAGAESKDA